MSKRSSKYSEILDHVGSVDDVGIGGNESIEISVRHYVQVDTGPDPLELNAWEARLLGKALIKAAKKLDRR